MNVSSLKSKDFIPKHSKAARLELVPLLPTDVMQHQLHLPGEA